MSPCQQKRREEAGIASVGRKQRRDPARQTIGRPSKILKQALNIFRGKSSIYILPQGIHAAAGKRKLESGTAATRLTCKILAGFALCVRKKRKNEQVVLVDTGDFG